jgi:hypothetical protein
MFCSKCGKQLDDDVKYCPNCGETTGYRRSLGENDYSPSNDRFQSNSTYAKLERYLAEPAEEDNLHIQPVEKRKRSIALFLSAALGIAYAIYILSYLSGLAPQVLDSNSARSAGTAIGMALIAPHATFALIAALFNLIGWLANARWAALTAGILYSVAALLMLMYALFVAVQIMLCFVAFAKMKPQSA